MELMDRWLKDWRAEESWNKVKRKAPNLAPTEFIKVVLALRRSAGASVTRILGRNRVEHFPGSEIWEVRRTPGFNEQWAELLPDLKKRVVRRLSGTPLAIKVVAFLEDAAREVSQLHRSYFGFPDQVNFKLLRQGSNDDRSRNAFIKLMAIYLQKHCGGTLPDVIAVLAEIAFPGKDVTRENVIDALKVLTSKNPRPAKR
jgi:hypothetical protein